jgi:hypothetical protein
MRLWLAGAVVAAVLGTSPAIADRPPTDAERAAIDQALRAQGYTEWRKAEFDDERWEVDKALAPDGKRYDLYLDAKTLQVTNRELDDDDDDDDD